jgi:hypothetical protein
MTQQDARRILDAVRYGVSDAHPRTITRALIATGDIAVDKLHELLPAEFTNVHEEVDHDRISA